jgi:hypothetical protein
MLANYSDTPVPSGTLGKHVHLPESSRYALLDFIADELPRWRDRPDRRSESSETALTSQLCAHLNSAARHSIGWDILQFRVEEPDEERRGRRIDLVSTPCAVTIWIDGRRHADFDTLLPMECKRLPTPAGPDRDEREYVFTRKASTGGIQRFKAGHHGAAHRLAAMIAYVQEGTLATWRDRVTGWITELADSLLPGWSAGDLIHLERDTEALGLTVYRSSHSRGAGLPDIELRHIWLRMN